LKVNRMKHLYIQELKELYTAENLLAKALPEMAKAANSQDLRVGFEGRLEQAREHVARLKETFNALGENPNGKTDVGSQTQ
jgi:ferritin-like metal-binding protein YciE